MRKIALVLLLSFATTSCTGSTVHGECIGIVEDGNPNLKYKISIWNAFLAVIFFETIVVPIVWAVDYAKCPVDTKQP